MYKSVQAHPYHLVEPSPWPIMVSFALLTTTLSGVMTFHGYSNGPFLLALGVIATTATMALWFVSVTREGTGKFQKVPSINLTVCWKILRASGTRLYSVTIQRIGQSAENQRNQMIPSRILRDYTLNIDRFMLETSTMNSTVKAVNYENKFIKYENVGAYLAGLLEGDGYIEIQRENSDTKKVNPRFVFTFHKNNLSLFEELHNFIGSGFFKTGDGNTMRFVIADKQGVIKLINLMNGYFRTPKILTFHKLIDKLNKDYSLNILKFSIDHSALDSNAWLAGFAEADGYFGVLVTEFKPKSENRKRSQSRRVKCRFVIEQRQFDKSTNSSCKSFMEMIANYFNVSLLTSIRETKFTVSNSTYYLSVESTDKLSKVIKYFDKYPLMGVKSLDYKDFKTIYLMILNKDHLTDLGREKIKNLVLNMNSNRK